MSIRLIALLLGLFTMGSAIGVVSAKHETRKLFVELQALNKEQDRLDVDWGRLQLEQSTWATHGRIERIAHDQLGMALPKDGEVVIVRP